MEPVSPDGQLQRPEDVSASMPSRREPWTRAVLAGAALLALLVVVALATRGNLGSSHGGPGPGQGFVDYVFTIVMAVFVLLIPVAVYFYWIQREQLVYEVAAGGRRKRSYANVATAFFLIGIALWIEYLRHHRGSPGFRKAPSVKPSIPGTKRVARDSGTEPLFHWWLFALIVGLALATTVTAVVLVRRRRAANARAALTAAEAVSEALDDALDDLREGDPREAVIRAYARTERILAVHGLPREPHEAPFEWLGRILVGLRASAPSVERLVGLFERARFSRHTIDERMREEAIRAVTTVRDELRAAPA